MVGAGAGGVELLLAMQHRLRTELLALGRDPGLVVFHLFAADSTVVPTHNPGVQRRFEAVLRARGVQVHRGATVLEVAAGRLRTAAYGWFDADEIIWVTRAGGAPWLRDTGLALDADGCVRVNSCLQSVSDPLVFAAGDVASMDGRPLEKAGVFAVRMGRPLADNLRRSVADRRLRPYTPQRRWLALAAPKKNQRAISTMRLRKSIIAGRVLTPDEMMADPADRGRNNHIPYINRLCAWWRQSD